MAARRPHTLALLLTLLAAQAAAGCATGTRQLDTPRYSLTMSRTWEVKAEGKTDGQPTTLLAGRTPQDQKLPTEVEVRIYAWAQPSSEEHPTRLVASFLATDPGLQLNRHLLTPEQPLECNLPKRTYSLLGAQSDPLDLLSRPGWRTILVGASAKGSLVGVVARVSQEEDQARYCRNLAALQEQLQALIVGLEAVTPPPAPAVAPTPPPRPESLPLRPY